MKVPPKKDTLRAYNRSGNVLQWALPLGIALLTFICYHYSIGNEFTNWDDERFIPQNIFIKSFSSANLKMMLFHDVTMDYYNPITILSYAVNYHFSGIAPQSYYITNIIIHILNSCLMFFMVLMFLKAMEKAGYGIFKWKEWVALFCTLAYAIHPMHVESVSWAAERKDVLYAFFYFLGMMAYLKYAEVKNIKWFLWVIVCFLLSLLSKPMAVVFPFSLVAIDILLKRDKASPLRNVVWEKVPFILISVISAIFTYIAARSSGAVQEHQVYNFFQRFLFASYGFYMYIVKAFIPIPLSSYYPYPDFTGPTGALPILFYLSPLIALLVAALPLYLSYHSGTNSFRVVLFGIIFYFFNMIIVSQIIGSGPTMMADRYSYICYFGIFFPVTYFVYQFIQKRELGRKISTIVLALYLGLFAFLCYQRTLVWHSSETLWSDVVKQYPHRIIKAYNNLGNYYFEHADLDKAYDNYMEAIDLKTGDPQVYCNMGSLMGAKKEYKVSLFYYTQALKIDSNDGVTYLNRAITYSAMGRYELAIKDYRRSSYLNPNSEILMRNIAFTYLNAHIFDSAIVYYNKAIQINPDNPGYYHYRGVAKFDKGDVQPAMDDFMKNLQIAPHDSECMFYISIGY
ncbi:MAG TPA: tetratricopeptide repeat protein, partial [Bacteroidia bacterium]|nr:tetratricopeptide repeat protein [Bacteroidia bacterium]